MPMRDCGINSSGELPRLKRGQLVKYVHWSNDKLLAPIQKVGILLTNANEVGKVRVCFGQQIMWVWVGDLEMFTNSMT